MIFLQIDKESKSEKNYVCVGGLPNVREQVFQIALLLFKENTCAKLF